MIVYSGGGGAVRATAQRHQRRERLVTALAVLRRESKTQVIWSR